jgi:predicted nucleotidyltransferase
MRRLGNDVCHAAHHPCRSFYAQELIHLAGSGSGAVQRELAKLTSAGIISLRRVGNQTHYQANPASPVYEELRSLILKTSGLVDVLRSGLAPRAGEISAAFVFGSVAKRVDTASSDIDVLIVSDTLSYAELFTLLETATRRLGRAVNPTLYSNDEMTARLGKKNAFITKVFAQDKLWIIGSERDIAP